MRCEEGDDDGDEDRDKGDVEVEIDGVYRARRLVTAWSSRVMTGSPGLPLLPRLPSFCADDRVLVAVSSLLPSGLPSTFLTASRQNCILIAPIAGLLVTSGIRAVSTFKARRARYASRAALGMKVWRM